jgi:hypothetical protein
MQILTQALMIHWWQQLLPRIAASPKCATSNGRVVVLVEKGKEADKVGRKHTSTFEQVWARGDSGGDTNWCVAHHATRGFD